MTIIGVVAGIGLFLLTRPLVAKIPLDKATWFPASIVPPLLPALVLLLLIPVVGVGAAVVALRRVVVTPLGVQRRQTPGMPGVRRAVPLVASLLLLPVAIGVPARRLDATCSRSASSAWRSVASSSGSCWSVRG